MREPPRIRRLRTDLKALEALRAESTIVDFDTSGSPPDEYLIRFFGLGVWRVDDESPVQTREVHEVRIRLGASYPRQMPEVSWRTPIFHPNIAYNGTVCLGGYGKFWVPSLNLDELCEMLWDMVRYQNYDVTSPYNRDAARWAAAQERFNLPVDPRPIRDKLASQPQPDSAPSWSQFEEIEFLDDDIVEAELAEPDEPEVFIIE